MTDDKQWIIDYEGDADKDTIMMLSTHNYWNLDAFSSTDTVKDHVLQIAGDRIIEADSSLIPTGGFEDVKGTPFDFNEPKAIGKDLDAAKECG